MDLKEENAEMKAKLADRLRKSKTASKVEERLAKMAGIKKDLKNDDTDHSDEYDTESDEDSDIEEAGGSKITGKMRSDEVKNDVQSKGVKNSNDVWKHDKFDKDDDEDVGGSKRSDGRQFGKHWGRSRRGRSKDRSNSKSRSRKRSGSKSSRSRSRSRSREKRKRRRGKFSASRSRSSSSAESSRSRSRHRSYSSRSNSRGRTSSRSKSRKSENNNKSVDDDSNKNPEKEGINLELSGALTADSNTVNGSVVKYSQPPEARKPKKKWRLYVFKGSEELPILYIHRQSAYLLGRDRKVADIPVDHPSCSKQHAALQYRLVPYTRADNTQGRRVQLYVMDLNSANGTFVNNNKIETQKYIQLLEKDVLKFGFSSREYVLLHDQSKDDEEDVGVD